ncbi:DNA/RNA polymerase superfamily protein, partial [Dorcoceras hygrometricum]
TNLTFSTAFHLQTDGQSKRVIQTLGDLLHACTLDFSESWDVKLTLVEFTYNNSYQASIEMAPYEALYGRKCRSPINLDVVGERTSQLHCQRCTVHCLSPHPSASTSVAAYHQLDCLGCDLAAC